MARGLLAVTMQLHGGVAMFRQGNRDGLPDRGSSVVVTVCGSLIESDSRWRSLASAQPARARV